MAFPTPTVKWNLDSDGDWSTAADWSTGKLPISSDDVSIDTTDLHTIIFSKMSATVHSLVVGNDDFTMTGGSLTISSVASFANQLSLSGGSLRIGSQGATVGSFAQSGGTLAGAGTVAITGTAALTGTDIYSGTGTTVFQGQTAINAILTPIGGRTIENKGTINCTGGFWQPDDATFKNDAGAVINFSVHYPYNNGINNAKGNNAFLNAGSLNVQNGSGSITYIYVPLTNTGTVNVQSGELDLCGGGSSNANGFKVTAGATVVFSTGFPGNTQTISPTFTMTGGTFSVAGKLSVLGGTLDLSVVKIVNLGAQGLTIGSLLGGKLELGAQNATVGSVTLQPGFEGYGGVIDGTGTLTITGATNFNAGGETGTGTTLLVGSAKVVSALGLSGGRVLENRTTLTINGGTLNGGTVKNDAGATLRILDLSTPFGSTTTNTIVNAGTFAVNAGATGSSLGIALANTGTISLGNSTLGLNASGDVLGGIITGKGSVLLNSTEIPGGPTFPLNDATVGNLKILGGATLSNGDNTTQTAAVAILNGSVINQAKMNWHIADKATLSGSGIFTNLRTLEKDSGTGVGLITAAVVNSGTVEALSGVLKLGKISGTGTLMVGNAGRLRLQGPVGAGQTVEFDQVGGALVLADVSDFAGQISHFDDPSSLQGKDSIELTNFAFGASETVTFTEDPTRLKGVLTITDGALHAKLTLFGQYVVAGFHLASNHAGGTAITYEEPGPSQVPQLAPHG
jgi:hypothetical protein